MAKAKPASHTSKELANKAKASTINRGGGAAGAADRSGGAAGHAKFECPLCGQRAPDPKTGKILSLSLKLELSELLNCFPFS